MAHQVQSPAYSRILARVFGIVGGFRTRLDPIITPVVISDDLTPQRWLPCAGAVTVAAPAGQLAALSIRNPAPSGKIIYVERAELYSGATELWLMRTNVGVAPGVIAGVQGNLRDGRYFPQFAPLGELWLDNNAAPAGSNLGDIGIRGGIERDIDLGILLRPDQNFTMYNQTVNQTMIITFYWRERDLETAEPILT